MGIGIGSSSSNNNNNNNSGVAGADKKLLLGRGRPPPPPPRWLLLRLSHLARGQLACLRLASSLHLRACVGEFVLQLLLHKG